MATEIPDEVIAALSPTTPIQVLPLSNRAKNALDRAGLLCVSDLRDLPQNRLSAMRGVGRQVAKDILEFRARWERLGQAGPSWPAGASSRHRSAYDCSRAVATLE